MDLTSESHWNQSPMIAINHYLNFCCVFALVVEAVLSGPQDICLPCGDLPWTLWLTFPPRIEVFLASHSPSGEKEESVRPGRRRPASCPESHCWQHPGSLLALAASFSGETREELWAQLGGIVGFLCFSRFCPLAVEHCTSRHKVQTLSQDEYWWGGTPPRCVVHRIGGEAYVFVPKSSIC